MFESQLQNTPHITAINNEAVGIHRLFEQMATSAPDKVAVIFNNNLLTYRQLNEEANKLAKYLTDNYQIKPDSLIGIMLDRSEKMIIGILAILKAGAAYLPIDPNGNTERTNFICLDAGLQIVLCDKPVATDESLKDINFIDISERRYYQGDGENLSVNITGNNLAYVMYTSGSTGIPKGALIKHENLINFVSYFYDVYRNNTEDVFLQITSFFFDVSVIELFVPLVSGSCIVFLEPGMHRYPEKILDAITKYGITMIFFTPVVLQLLLSYITAVDYRVDSLKSLKRVFVGGEALSVKLANLFNKIIYQQTRTGLTNIYGPTEATVWVTTWDAESNDELQSVFIGKPINNAEIYILDSQMAVLPDGEAGELVIGGIPVGRGYLNRPELDSEKFVKNPFRAGEKIYKTGDKARYLPDGNIEFLGRIDNQIKLNGLRIELGEIESAILKNDKIKECIALLKEVNEANELVAYFTLTNDKLDESTVIDELVTDLTLQLPKYMIPAFYLKLDTFSINSNGKIDKKSLPLPVWRYCKRDQPFISPSSNTEKQLAKIFQELLNIESISINDLIFDIGVKSLMVTKIIIQINKVLKTQISVSQFFQLPTIGQLAQFIDNQADLNLNPFTLIRLGKGAPLFLLPGVPGNPLHYSNFVLHYQADTPIYSIVFADEEDTSSIKGLQHYDSLQDYSSYLLNQIKQIQPDGPYNIVGFSLGGAIAFEIATQLQQLNNEVGLLGIISTDPAVRPQTLVARFRYLRELNFLLGPKFYLVIKYIRYRIPFLLKELKAKIKRSLPTDTDENSSNLFKKSKLAQLSYSYQSSSKFQGDIILIYEDLEKSNFSNFKHHDYYITNTLPQLWKKFVDGKVQTHVINCMHLEMLLDPFVKEIADVIADYFSQNPHLTTKQWQEAESLN